MNYNQDPNEVIDYRGPDFHEPTPNMLAHLKEHGKIISREELEKILAKEKTEQLESRGRSSDRGPIQSQEFARDRLSVELARERATKIYANQDSQAKASSSVATVDASLGAGLGIVLAVVRGAASALWKP